MKKIGFTIGKFAPLHKGHQLLIQTALNEMDELYIVIYETKLIDVPLNERARWIEKLYPKAKICFATNPPKKFGLDNGSINIQMDYLSKIIKDKNPTHFYSNEQYGKYVAKYLNIENRQIDINKEIIPISATKIRENLEYNKNYIEKFIYNDCKRYIRK